MDFRDYIEIFQRRWKLVVATTLIVLALGASFTFTRTPTYQSTARLFVTTSPSDTSDAYQGALFSVQRVTSYADLVDTSHELAQSVIGDLKLDLNPADLLAKISTSVDTNTVVLSISATDSDPKIAQEIAESYANDLTGLVRTLETPPGQSIPPIKATVVDSASLPSSPVSPQPVRNLALSLALGLLLGLGASVLRELLDNSVKDEEGLAEISQAPLLGSITFDPAARRQPLVTSLGTHDPRVEAFRVLRTNLQFVDVDATNRVVVVTSALPGEGKTTTAVNLALTLAQAGVSTLLLEADLRRPRLHDLLSMDQSVGVTSILIGRAKLGEAVQVDSDSGLAVVTSGPIPPNPADLLQSKAMAQLLVETRQTFEVTIVDAPPLLPVTDAALISTASDSAVLVVRHSSTTRDQVRAARARLETVGTGIAGTIFNMVPKRSGGEGYGYGYGYAPEQAATRRFRRNKGD